MKIKRGENGKSKTNLNNERYKNPLKKIAQRLHKFNFENSVKPAPSPRQPNRIIIDENDGSPAAGRQVQAVKNQFQWEEENYEESVRSEMSSDEKGRMVPFYEKSHMGVLASRLNFRSMADRLNNEGEENGSKEEMDARYLSNRKKMKGKILFDLEGKFLKWWNIVNTVLIVSRPWLSLILDVHRVYPSCEVRVHPVGLPDVGHY